LKGFASAEILIAKDQYLYKPSSESRRLLLEPGTILLRKKIPKEQTYYKRVRVITLGGVEGEVRPKGIDRLSDISEPLAYVKNEVVIKGNKYSIGTIFPLKVIEDEDETIYKVTYPKTIYSVKNSGFSIKNRSKEFSPSEFYSLFNIINPEKVSFSKFPLWVSDTRHSATEWGCTKGSKEEVLELDANAGASLEAEGGFFSFFQAKAEVGGAANKKTIYHKKLEDPNFEHRITYWNLVNASNRSVNILKLALEKISVCDSSKGVNNSYIVRFDQNLNLEEIKLNSVWVKENGFNRGGGSPIRIDTQEELHKFEDALKDFKLLHTKNGFDVRQAIIDFSIQYTANLNYAPRS